MFPVPSEGITIPEPSEFDRPGERWTLRELLTEYGRVTNTHLMLSEDTIATLMNQRVPIDRGLVIAPEDVHSVVEKLCAHSGYAFTLDRASEPRLIGVKSLYTAARTNLRQHALWVPTEELDQWKDHSAFLISTVLHFEHTDARTLTNSMRAMLTDANTQQIIPVGNSNTSILVGFAPHVHGLVQALQTVDEYGARAAESAEATDS